MRSLKLLFPFLLLIFINSNQTQAQIKDTFPSFSNKGIYISAGYGAISFAYLSEPSLGIPQQGYPAEVGPFYLKFEKRMGNFGIGINLAYLYDKWTYNLSGDSITTNNKKVLVNAIETDTRSTYSVLLRINYHFIYTKKFDIYYGFGIGGRLGPINQTVNFPGFYRSPEPKGNDDFPIGFECSVGARYFISPCFALYAEAGLCKSLIQAGISYNVTGK
jgi:hypothetical protein